MNTNTNRIKQWQEQEALSRFQLIAPLLQEDLELLFTPTPAIRFFIQSAENEKIFIHSALVFWGVKC